MIKSLTDYYRCPSEFVGLDLIDEPSGNAGYFRLGPQLVGYGRAAAGATAPTCEGFLHDLAQNIRIERGRCLLPFRPDEVIDNLRLERYMAAEKPAAHRAITSKLVRNLYYFLRPALSVSIRKHLQRASLENRKKGCFPNWPLDRTVDAVIEQLMLMSLEAKGLRRFPFIWFWPDAHSACSIMTHDVETAAGRDFCSELMDIDDSFGVKASFQVVPLERYSVPSTLLQGIRDRGFEVNVHDLNHDGHLYRDHEQFRQRAAKINSYLEEFGAQGFRAAVLYRNLEWYDALACAYDMSVPNVGRLDPQPGGCCTVMPYFVGNILEIPVTTTQDYSLFNILGSYSIELWQQQIRLIMEQNGLISFIVHPDYLDSPRARTAYSALLEHVADLKSRAGLWIALPREVNQWWRQRSEMKLVRHGEEWRIEGEGSERACLAYATLSDGKLTYSLAGSAPESKLEPGAGVGTNSLSNVSVEC